jgi:NAD(P)H-nitrite reductase large subunit
MELDDEVCLCFHVTKRKLLNFLRLEKPRRAAQMSDCFGAGTGCGWCRSHLEKMFAAHQTGAEHVAGETTAQEHARGRSNYVRAGKGMPPPGASPLLDET